LQHIDAKTEGYVAISCHGEVHRTMSVKTGEWNEFMELSGEEGEVELSLHVIDVNNGKDKLVGAARFDAKAVVDRGGGPLSLRVTDPAGEPVW
jgi:hypothetical protein